MKRSLKVLIFFIIFICTHIYSEDGKKNIITINSAQYTEYVKVPAAPISEEKKDTEKNDIDEDKNKKDDITKPDTNTEKESSSKKPEKKESEKDELIIFTGLVSVSVSDGSSVSTITADKVIYNKTRDSLTAIGNVFYERKIDSSKGESFKGEYLIFSVKKQEGVFVNGILEQAPTKKNKEPFKIHTEMAGRNESGTITFKDAFLTTSKETEPLWSIRSTRLWILPGNEIAFFNGFLSIGTVPIMYLPFFYYPADEMIFHPVFGFKNREGSFLQTTTYLYGRKPLPKADEESSFSNFLQSDTLKEQKLEGLFFKNLDEPAKNIGSSYLKLVGDVYSSLGYLVGLDGKFTPKKGYIKQIDFHSFFGFSNTLYPVKSSTINLKYSKYNNHGKFNKNKSNLFGKQIPFRYDFNLEISMTKNPFSLSIKFPLVSDPFFKKDFMGRSETMNWFKYLLDKDKLAALEGPATISSYSWKADGSIRPSFQILQPWISSINLDSISVNLNFDSKENDVLKEKEKRNTDKNFQKESDFSPERKFFYPKNLLPEFRTGISGTIFSTAMLNKKTKTFKKTEIEGIENPFTEKFAEQLKHAVENKQSEENDLQEKPEDKKTKENKTPEDKTQQDNLLHTLFPAFKLNRQNNSDLNRYIDYSLTYRLSGSFLQDTIFDHLNWKSPDDIKWQKLFSNFYKINGTFGINSNFKYKQGLLDITNSIELAGNYQKHLFVKDKQKKEENELNNFKLNLYSLTNTNKVKYVPFIINPLFKPNYIEWAISETLAKNKFTGTYKKPEWKTEKVKWDKDYIKTHTVSAGLGVAIKEYPQLMITSINLPPLLQAYSWQGNFSLPYAKFNIYTKLFEKEKDKKKWFWEPLKLDLNLNLPYNITLNQSYSYNIEDKKNDKYSISFSWKGLSAFYNMNREVPYKFDPVQTWIPASTEKKFIPHSLGLSFSNGSSPFEIYSWKNRIKLQLSFSTNINFNLIRVTDSYFSFSPKISFKIHEFWDISFTSLSRNDSIACYFQDWFNLPVVIPGEKNIVKDLASSFFFWDEAARRRSGFKLKSLNFELSHYLKDWILKFSYSVKPVLRNEAKRKFYELAPTISFIVQWNPIGDIKIHAKKEDKKFTLDRGTIK